MKPPLYGFHSLIYLYLVSMVYAQLNLGQRIRREVFFLNLEDGYFGCQVNQSSEVLQLFELSKLCDGTSNCYQGSDENIRDLKCTNTCPYTQGHACQNGACLDGLCHCNDGYGGCGCEELDENECKYRPCDIFASCTNTLGSFRCDCFQGYEGDGLSCKDIDECQDPAIAAQCTENAWCCNLPAHYTCKCNDGFTGDGFTQCTDINECANPNACGKNANCNNLLGNYTCTCPVGFTGNPFQECFDMDECSTGDACGPGARCFNQVGGRTCECPRGYEGDPYSLAGCVDINECAASPCAKGALCSNGLNNFTCSCPLGYRGNPYESRGHCEDVNECLQNPCGVNANCIDTVGSYGCQCFEGFNGDPYIECRDIDECSSLSNPCGLNAICSNTVPGFQCSCPTGFMPNPTPQIGCLQNDVTIACQSNFNCVNNAECVNGQCICRQGFEADGTVCRDINECQQSPCGPNANCMNIPGGFQCICNNGYVGAPPSKQCQAPCEGVECGPYATCHTENDEAVCKCNRGFTYNQMDISAGCIDIDECDPRNGPSGLCGRGAICKNSLGAYSCQCPPGFTGNPESICQDIDECRSREACGIGAVCVNAPGSYSCQCPQGTMPDPDPYTECLEIMKCDDEDDCPGNAICLNNQCMCPDPNIGDDCRHPCEDVQCGPNADCKLINGLAKCLCESGYSGIPSSFSGCRDIDECLINPCGKGAICRNEPGHFSCECPLGFQGNPSTDGCIEGKSSQCGENSPCPSGEECINDPVIGGNVCVCQRGFVRDDETGGCRDVNECIELRGRPACGLNAICNNLPGSYDCQCPPDYVGNPFNGCQKCTTLECRCQPPYRIVGDQCLLANCSLGNRCPPSAECVTIQGGVSYCACPKGFTTLSDGSCQDINECSQRKPDGSLPCGVNANCFNSIGSYECICPPGTSGDPFVIGCAVDKVQCSRDGDCGENEKCVQPGKCICPPPYYIDNQDFNKCKSPCQAFTCSLNSRCTPTDPPTCTCLQGFISSGLNGCVDIDECRTNPCGVGAQCRNEIGSYKCECPVGTVGEPYEGQCKNFGDKVPGCSSDNDCLGDSKCSSSGECLSPCDDLSCGPNAYCEANAHIRFCRCNPGYVEGVSGECISMCDGFLCGENAKCIVADNGPTCRCEENYIGNPFPGGSCRPDICSATNPCEDPQTCVNGRCKARCEGIVCGVGAECDVTTNQCQCLPYFLGDPKLLCVPPVDPPSCTPGCGENAHCEYGQPNKCTCNVGYNGNPYASCSPKNIPTDCSTTKCGTNAQCKQGFNRVNCACPAGFRGNPYVECNDIDECTGNACGINAVCLNTKGSFDCRCQAGFSGNPFIMCRPINPSTDQCSLNPSLCSCSRTSDCSPGMLCENGKCIDPCALVKCGPNASCNRGVCVCSPGFSGTPTIGCQPPSECRNDNNCDDDEICFINRGQRRCVNACRKVQCGTNAICVSQDHRSSCICKEGFVPIPNDVFGGCRVESKENQCDSNDDCPDNLFCQIDQTGVKACSDPCLNLVCGQNEQCYTENEVARCKCSTGFDRNPLTSNCENPGVPECLIDSDCSNSLACRIDNLGVKKCVDACKDFTCGLHSFCVGVNHRGQCKCNPGFTGNPNDRSGCRTIPQDECSNDLQCSETEICSKVGDRRKCISACNNKECGLGAVCISKNHDAQCQCPPGLFVGDPNEKGCHSVSCLINEDCPFNQACDRLSFKCFDVCADACGDNAICIPEDHDYYCKCPPGSAPSPSAEIACSPINVCEPNPCHPTSQCSATGGTYKCECPNELVGDPYSTGCHPEGMCPNGISDCPIDNICINGRCASPCEKACGPNSVCTVSNRQPVCNCPVGFTALESPQTGCTRILQKCSSDAQCNSGICIEGQCHVICRSNDNCADNEKCVSNVCKIPCVTTDQCPSSQSCISRFCILGCKINSECPGNTACVNNKCIDPCDKPGVCGPNSICKSDGHIAICQCPNRFQAPLSPQQGCIRMPISCSKDDDCPNNHDCEDDICMAECSSDDECAQGERCTNNKCMKVCFNNGNCIQGEYCNDGSCVRGCVTKQDCSQNEVCISNKCMCTKGFLIGPNGCVDVDECDNDPCDSTAECINVPGSFYCSCPPGKVRSPSGSSCILPDECDRDDDCPGNQACKQMENNIYKCIDPCASSVCGRNARCEVENRTPVCQCLPGHYGDPNNLALGCVQGECISNNDCPMNRACDEINFQCIDPCQNLDCRYGRCQTINHIASCYCERGFEIDSATKTCIDMNECLDNPCHRSAECRNTIGSYSCICPGDSIGEPYNTGCRTPGTCITPSDCPMSATCIQGRCQNPCDSASCGVGARCRVVSHQPLCFCPPLTTGNPIERCKKLECDDIISYCRPGYSCIDNSCIDICSIPGSCGANSDCRFRGTQQTCTCKPGYTGNPKLGCTRVIQCNSASDCPSGEECNRGTCVPVCQNNRGCLIGQVCIEGVCIPTCRSNNNCPQSQVCQNNLCIPQAKCSRNSDCDDDKHCQRNAFGQAECKDACDGLILCGRNAKCISENHKAVCQCPEGYHGDPMDEKIGCKEIQCNENDDCASAEICENYQCKVACPINHKCGRNAICISENHKAVCFCRNGYQGDPLTGCRPVDFCKNNPCALGARCVNSFGSYKCVCPRGTVGDPVNSGCDKPVECNSDSQCSSFSYCDAREQKCKDACDTETCGANAECQTVRHRPVCRCYQGYQGNAKVGCRPEVISCKINSDCPPNTVCSGKLCRPPCQSDNECGLSEACINGQCNNLCSEDSACGLNSDCKMLNHRKQCSCPSGFTGKPDIECYRLPEACLISSDCKRGFSCQSGVCTPMCRTDESCALNEKCIGGMCLLACRLDNDCFLGHVCLNNMCVIGCRVNEDCAATESCINSQCSNPCESGSACGPNSECNTVNHRAKCLCPAGFIPNPTPNIGCVREPVSCKLNTDCREGFLCNSGTCSAICSSSENCLSNERCDGFICRPVCRLDDDCRSGEICGRAMCVAGCRDNSECSSDKACINRKCADPCSSPRACGVNAQCSVQRNKAVCKCPANMVGDPYVNCRQPPTSCSSTDDCPNDMSCISGTCKPKCSNDEACLTTERCIGGVCKEICSSHAQCGPGNICSGRVCIAGCRTDSTCRPEGACINRKCSNPCEEKTSCGLCAECKVVNHRPQCSCPASTIGNPSIGCNAIHKSCSSSGQCSNSEVCEGFCFDKCDDNDDCRCGETCYKNVCRPKCNRATGCSKGFLCDRGACVAGCRVNSDCPIESSCINRKCQDPCKTNPCGQNAECRSTDHRSLCICPNGYRGDPYVKCEEYDCLRDSDCSQDKACINGECKDQCLLGKCGLNAECKTIQHKVECSCLPNYYGNPNIRCTEDINECLRNPCANNAQCVNTVGSYNCVCKLGCQGDPFESGCICPQDQRMSCETEPCGLNAQCRETSYGEAECYCPPRFPVGNPDVICKADCRQTGCGLGAECRLNARNNYECVCKSLFNGDPYVECYPDTICTLDTNCRPSQACLGGQCKDPCTVKDSCGSNAICEVINHQVICSCTECYKKDIGSGCVIDPNCIPDQESTPKSLVPTSCKSNSDCPKSKACISGNCNDPCSLSKSICEINKKCEVRKHEPICLCKYGFTINSAGEFICAGGPIECRVNEDCSSTMACIDSSCVNPCSIQKPPLCPPTKQCSVANHQPVCICEEECQPSVLLCLNDKGCPSSQACIKYQCMDPCESHVCPGDSPCYVEDHQPLCKFCPPGYTIEENVGCVAAIGCDSDSDCPTKQACINDRCQNPCVAKNPCDSNEDCKIEGQNAICIAIGCRKNSDCDSNEACINKECVSPCKFRDPCTEPKECQVSDHVAFCHSACTCDENSDCDSGYSCDGCTCRSILVPVVTCSPPCRQDEKCDPVRRVCVQTSVTPLTPQKPSCSSNFDCLDTEKCINNQCKDICSLKSCGLNARCSARRHNALCTCPVDFTGNPNIRCTKVVDIGECNLDADCPITEVCYNEKCENPCKIANPCASKAECSVQKHRPVCVCFTGFRGDPYTFCSEDDNIIGGCRKNTDCPSTQACYNSVCKYPCDSNPCGTNAECINTNFKSQCICRNGFTGNPLEKCNPVSTVKPGCFDNDDCASNLICEAATQECIDPCIANPCAYLAECIVVQHEVQCKCPKGYTGNGFLECSLPSIKRDCPSGCPSHLACISGTCRDPCNCGTNALCEVFNHRATCKCPQGYQGDPLRSCLPVAITNPCDIDPCGVGAICELDNGNPICSCPRGTTGNPFVKCIPDGETCETNDCGPNSGCRVVQGRVHCFCLPEYVGDPPRTLCSRPQTACEPSPCGLNTNCHIVGGFHRCTCKAGFVGNPNTIRGCDVPVNPCNSQSCGIGALCNPSGSPLCYCRPGLVGDPFIRCKAPPPKCQRGNCGMNAECYEEGYDIKCRCLSGYKGDPHYMCTPIPDNPCEPNPCGANTNCRVGNYNNAVCSCLSLFFGDPNDPIGCKPECIRDSDCPSTKACYNTQCQDPCVGACGFNAECRVVNHKTSCQCPKGYEGNPFAFCSLRPLDADQKEVNPCIPSPCGSGTECRVRDDQAICLCLRGYIGEPYSGCRPECITNSDCDDDEACINLKCQDPCKGTCGIGADCEVDNHNPICFCPKELTGDPFIRCVKITTQPLPPIDPCNPNPCGPNNLCRLSSGTGAFSCSCLPGFFGSPCRPECTVSSDCPSNRACLNQRCIDPCPGSCGANALCTVVAHNPICRCRDGYTGDPFSSCFIKPEPPVIVNETPCFPNPCGPNAKCEVHTNRPVCSCLPRYFGEPPFCRPECTSNAECPRNKACIQNKCQDPCPGICGRNAECEVVNHNPICFCPSDLTGDPFVSCAHVIVTTPKPILPCAGNPCGPNSICKEINNRPVCSCQLGFFGLPPDCRPECVVHSECPSYLACMNNKCLDPCQGLCGVNAECSVKNHNPICNCVPGYSGDPFVRCILIREPSEPHPPAPPPASTSIAPPIPDVTNSGTIKPKPPIKGTTLSPLPPIIDTTPSVFVPRPPNPCEFDPCGANANCHVKYSHYICKCKEGYFGNAELGCRPECVLNSDCGQRKTCVNQKCINACPGNCAPTAECHVINHKAKCSCMQGYVGDPYKKCYVEPIAITTTSKPPAPITQAPCVHSPCGRNAQCIPDGSSFMCKCIDDYYGDPYYGCKPECTTNSDCPFYYACVKQKCIDPCPGTCGVNADCQVVVHSPVCTCRYRYHGDPYDACSILPPITTPAPNVCESNPCGPNSDCKEEGGRAVCACKPGYFGNAPNCRPECVENFECINTLACINRQCRDPCQNVCGIDALCEVKNHNPICYCPKDLTGDPYIRCRPFPSTPKPPVRDPCQCGDNAECRRDGDSHYCKCLPNFYGNPYDLCEPECVINSGCPNYYACENQKCIDPCPGTCGLKAICEVYNHRPLCICPQGMVGDPLVECKLPELEPEDLCDPNPCGPYTECRVINNRVSCQCLPGYPGTPQTSCAPECTTNSDCHLSDACINRLCVDPCKGSCHPSAECTAVSHHPSCICPDGYMGNPSTTGCTIKPEVKENPCDVCGENAECVEQYDGVICKCPPNYFGNPYIRCKPECIINQDCPNYLSCQNYQCKNPCVGACGINALCDVVKHYPGCSCPTGYVGDPYIECLFQLEPVPEPECRSNSECDVSLTCINEQCKDPCALFDVCAANAQCYVANHLPVCTCPDGYTGNPSVQCIVVGCRDNSECPAKEACINAECDDPCRFEECGTLALCRVIHQRAQCYCPELFTGDPYIECLRPECITDDECPDHLACINQKCSDPCNCGEGADCRVVNHRAQCVCPIGYMGDPFIRCDKTPIIEEPPKECTTDGDCPSKMACFDGDCQDPCSKLKPCAPKAYCEVKDTLPFRSMTCICPIGYHGDAYEQCLLKSPDPVGCKVSVDCGLAEVCRNDLCVDPCIVGNPCAQNAECKVSNRELNCVCPPGMTGDPRINCYLITAVEPECKVDSDCPDNEACYNERCDDPCTVEDPCGKHALCQVKKHRPICYCPEGWFGDPTVECFKAECVNDLDCPTDKACRDEKCINPCTYEGHLCGNGAECRAILHRAQCYCPTGTQGNPNKACVSVGCLSNDDCSDVMACDRLNLVCIPVCSNNTCAKEAHCVAANHAAMCKCLPGFSGNPLIQCAEAKLPVVPSIPEPKCRTDHNCPSNFVCINELCIDPCAVDSPCTLTQKCRVLDSTPLRTVVCECPPNQYLQEGGVCARPDSVIPECTVNTDCADFERCLVGTCRDVCRPTPCGINALCRGSNHRSECVCAPDFTGDPYRGCIRAIPHINETAPQCATDDDCSDQKSCVNQHCINPCILRDPCSKDAFCYVRQHRPVCKCPDGFVGDPYTECKPVDLPISIGCTVDKECPNNKACINTKCVIPCDCGPNAECNVIDHRPLCTCMEGFQGDPITGCYRIGCRNNEECPTDKMCYSGVCVNPCYIDDPCALSAECFPEEHKSLCRCPSGLKGDPYTQCEIQGCQSNSQCPTDKACINRQCINPCLYDKDICAPSAECYVFRHVPGCRCPADKPYGDPRFICRDSSVSVVGVQECRVDRDCPSQEACINQKCVNPCLELDPCHDTAKCKVIDSLPVRTMVCICREGFVMDQDNVCKIVELQITPECRGDSECGTKEACINKMCRNPCNCGTNADCDVIDHRSICTCQVGFLGNPDVGCFPVGCTLNSDCEDDKACYEGVCANPCLVSNPCAVNAECYAQKHRARCRCPSGLLGDGYTQCLVIGCRANSNCPPNRACINDQCLDPCLNNPCTPTAECVSLDYQALCRCPAGTFGEPSVRCEPVPKKECYTDSDCPSQHACFSGLCANPCLRLNPCDDSSLCKVIDSLPLRTMMCVCPDGKVITSDGTCKDLPPIKSECEAHETCPSQKACVNGLCKEACQCGINADCEIVEHHAVCSCKPGFEGDPEIQCYEIGCFGNNDCAMTHACKNGKCSPVCGPSNEPCGKSAICRGINHQPQCLCPPGLRGNPNTQCIAIGCLSNDNCPGKLACVNERCEDPCGVNPCVDPASCVVEKHLPICECPPGFNGTVSKGCEKIIIGCTVDSECPELACINGKCEDICALYPCGENAKCRMVNTLPLRMAVCECLPGYQGHASEICLPVPVCPLDKGFVITVDNECVCPYGDGHYVDQDGYCRLCPTDKGFVLSADGVCVCDPIKGYVLTSTGVCDCPQPLTKGENGFCVLIAVTPYPPICTVDEDCPQDRMCENEQCIPPCSFEPCSQNAICVNANHTAVCYCLPGFEGDPYDDDGCKPIKARTDFPRSPMSVNCLADGVQLMINIGDPGFNGLMYVKGYSKNEECRRILRQDVDVSVIEFKVLFNTCGLIHENGLARFILVIQKHPKLVTYDAQAYHVKCTYSTGEKTIAIGFNVSMLTTAGTIANTGPPPRCLMKITNQRGGDINQAEIGDLLLLNVIVEPSDIYGGFVRSCFALTSDEDGENQYMVTDENGCAADPPIFQDWQLTSNKTLVAPFNAFKFPASNAIRFQCNVRVCFGRCHPVNCNGYDAFGKRKKRQISEAEDDAEFFYAREATAEGQMREIQVSSQSILTVERRSERLTADEDLFPQIDEVCVSKWGFIIALVITALLALVAVAVAVSCWLMAYRRRPKHGGPLPHPDHFPNPLFTTPEPLAEPSPDYMS